MSRDPLREINPRQGTVQKEQARADQVLNNAGGYVFKVSELSRLDRFLMLGTDGGSYYVSEKELTKENAQFVIDYAKRNATEMVDRIVQISESGRAPRQNATLFALAAACVYGNNTGRYAANNAVPKVVRTGSHLFQFITYREQLGGWNRGLRWAVGQAWYNMKDTEKLAYQMVKYRTRKDWSHRDVLRLAHPKPQNAEHDNLYAWAVGKKDADKLITMPEIIRRFERLQKAVNVDEVLSEIQEGHGQISWEMIPDKFMNEPRVWEALILEGIPQTALMRQLSRLTRIGVLGPFERWNQIVADLIRNPERIQKARVHPINILMAQRTYSYGQGIRSSWEPVPVISDALNDAFYKAFKTVEPTGKRILLAVDVSGSMGSPINTATSRLANQSPVTARDAAAAIALVTAATEPNHHIIGFSDGTSARIYGRLSVNRPGTNAYTAPNSGRRFGYSNSVVPLNITPSMRLDTVIQYTQSLNFGGTDCALPMLYAKDRGLSVDAFIVLTDNETWYGDVHPFEALKQYRQKTGINAKLIVVSMTANNFSIADPSDPGMLDIVGFDSSVVSLIQDFITNDSE